MSRGLQPCGLAVCREHSELIKRLQGWLPDARVSRFVNGLRRESWSTTMLESTTPVAVSGAATGVAARAATPVGVLTRR